MSLHPKKTIADLGKPEKPRTFGKRVVSRSYIWNGVIIAVDNTKAKMKPTEPSRARGGNEI